MLRERLKRILREAASLDAGADFSLDAPPKAEYGDYASNLPLGLAKALGKNPMSVAEELAAKIFDSAIAKITIAPPGFLNITISDEVLASKLERILEAGGRAGDDAPRGAGREDHALGTARRRRDVPYRMAEARARAAPDHPRGCRLSQRARQPAAWRVGHQGVGIQG